MTNGISNPLLRKRGGGPKTEAGKKASSQNAVKSGAYAQALILPGEDEQQFQELLDQFCLDFEPQDMAERSMVHDLAVLTWKKVRVEKIEHAEMIRLLKTSFSYSDFSDDSKITYGVANSIQSLECPLEVVSLSYQKACEWHEAESFPKGFDKVLERDYPVLFQWVTEMASDHFDVDFERIGWATDSVEDDYGKERPFYNYVLGEFVSRYRPMAWAMDHPDEARELIKLAQSARILKFVQSRSGRRALDDLDRAFYRTLNEFRKHQQWRRQRSEIDLNPEISSYADTE